MESTTYRNRLFARYGHKCEIDYTEGEFPYHKKTRNIFERFKNKLFTMSMVSEINRRATYYLKSQGVIAQERRKHLKYPQMIHPFSDIRIIWEVFMIFIYFMQFVSIPFDLCQHMLQALSQFKPSISFLLTRNILDICSCFDIILNFLTGYYNFSSREVVIAPNRVAAHYARTYFFIDLSSSLPTHIYMMMPFIDPKRFKFYTHLNLYIKHLKFFRLSTFFSLQYNCAQNFNLSFVTYRVTLTITLFVLYFHITCCIILFAMSKILRIDKDGIYTFQDGVRVNVTEGYLHALYQTAMIVCAAGYGNMILPYKLKVIIMFIWVFSKIFYIYLLAKIMEIVMAKTASSHKYVEMVRQLKEYMRHKQLPEYMQKRLLNYYEFRFQKSYFRETEILNTISAQLKQEIIMHSCRKLVENVGFFKNLPLSLLLRIVSCLKTEIFLVNDVIIKANTPGDCMYFISTGTVAIYTKSGREICHLEDGSHFGEITLVMKDQLRIASVIAVEICELYRLDRRDFVRAIYPYPDLLNHIKHIAADRMERTGILDEHNRREMASKRMMEPGKKSI